MTFDILKVLSLIFVASITVADSDVSSPCDSPNLGLQDPSLCSGRVDVRSRESSEISMQNQLRRKRDDEKELVECCPTLKILIEPEYGTNSQGHQVRLYRHGTIKQTFAEYVCKSDTIDAACSSFDPSVVKQSKCVQQFSLTNAITESIEATPSENKEDKNEIHPGDIKPKGFIPTWKIFQTAIEGRPWILDYITLRSGCNYVAFTENRSTGNL